MTAKHHKVQKIEGISFVITYIALFIAFTEKRFAVVKYYLQKIAYSSSADNTFTDNKKKHKFWLLFENFALYGINFQCAINLYHVVYVSTVVLAILKTNALVIAIHNCNKIAVSTASQYT